ncbi:MAG: lipopolysaccharide heptosyltransferase II [Planctomycetota bacterium]|nr:MAG: lipopolysaccharide heptosyltransferase II [Planctomycetota bacterium]
MVRLPNWVGDVVMSEPALAALRAAFPHARIVGLAKPYLLGLAELLGCDLLEPSVGLLGDTLTYLAAGADCAVLFPNSVSSALPPFLASVPQRVGYATFGRRVLLTEPLAYPRDGKRRRPIPMPLYYLRLVRRLGAEPIRHHPRLKVTSNAAEAVNAYLNSRGFGSVPLVAFNPGASYGPSKLWLTGHFARLADIIVERLGYGVVLLCGPKERHLADDIFRQVRNKRSVLNTSSCVVDLAHLPALLSRCCALVTTDTGPRHIALAVSTPTVTLMGPNDPRYTAYRTPTPQVVIRRYELDCIGCQKKVCPRGSNECMRRISPEQVFDALRRLQRAKQQ